MVGVEPATQTPRKEEGGSHLVTRRLRASSESAEGTGRQVKKK